jgi:hypothetical protein
VAAVIEAGIMEIEYRLVIGKMVLTAAVAADGGENR